MSDHILELRQAFDDAELRGDADGRDALLADDSCPSASSPTELSKQEWIDPQRDFRYLSAVTTDPDARHYSTTAMIGGL